MTNEDLNKVQYSYNKTAMSLQRVLDEKKNLHEAFADGIYRHTNIYKTHIACVRVSDCCLYFISLRNKEDAADVASQYPEDPL